MKRRSNSSERNGVLRSRWAAIGAAVAVTLGAGGLFTAGAASPESVFVAIEPTRVLDTRINVGLSGRFADGQTRLMDVTGTVPIVLPNGTAGTGTPIPNGATAVVANVTAVFPTSAGFVAVRPGNTPGVPTTSNLNFTVGGVVVPNSVSVELPTGGPEAGKVSLFFHGTSATATTDLLIDVVGYYTTARLADLQAQINAVNTGTAKVPSGATVVGFETYDASVIATGGSNDFIVQLPARARKDLTDDRVNFAIDANVLDGDANCTGSVAAPTAPQNKVCIYIRLQQNVDRLEGMALPALADTGFRVRTYTPGAATPGADQFIQISWAYHAP